jgi:chorismate mutase-like protein
MESLKPYRARIDKLDEEIIELLRRRYDVIEEVGRLKAREGIAATLPDRVDAVRERAAAMAAAKGLDADFIRRLYAQLIEHSCNREEDIIREAAHPKKAAHK